jgi:glyoxylase-like metal-dependent hydrolase (beta-lactamase superfamily II)
MISKVTYRSDHFTLEQLAGGVFAAVNSPNGWAICNAGIIDLGDRTLVYDAFMTPAAANDLRAAAEALTGRPVDALINSHYHNDHIWGNQAFSTDTDIISTAETRQLIVTEGAKEIKAYSEVIEDRLESVEQRLASTQDAAELVNVNLLSTYLHGIAAALLTLVPRLPNLTFTGELSLVGSKRSAKLLSSSGGHCASDAILYLPDDGIIFMEDLLFSGFHPYLDECDPTQVRQILSEIKSLDATVFVPGHGPVGGVSQLDWMVEYLDCLENLIDQVIDRGGREADLDKVVIPGECRSLLFPHLFPASIKFMYRHRQKP